MPICCHCGDEVRQFSDGTWTHPREVFQHETEEFPRPWPHSSSCCRRIGEHAEPLPLGCAWVSEEVLDGIPA